MIQSIYKLFLAIFFRHYSAVMSVYIFKIVLSTSSSLIKLHIQINSVYIFNFGRYIFVELVQRTPSLSILSCVQTPQKSFAMECRGKFAGMWEWRWHICGIFSAKIGYSWHLQDFSYEPTNQMRQGELLSYLSPP